MKLLITTQAVDINDPVLGFFVRWIEEFAKHCEQVEVICLRSGEYTFPPNVHVHTLHSRTKAGRTFEFLDLVSKLRPDYDHVFVHMNPEYLIVAGWYWRLFGIKTALWYTHKAVNMRLKIASFFTNTIFTASKESFRLPSSKLHIVGHGIDVDFFSPDPSITREDWALSVGRLTKSKRHDLAIADTHAIGKELKIAGDGPEREMLGQYKKQLGAHVTFLGALTQTQLRDAYRHAAYVIHRSETGSLDKVVLEARATHTPLMTNDPALKDFETLPPEYVLEHHSLQKLIPKILSTLS